jgi:4-aminobutyrate aminotransferase/(S)-3-amino-2-methylpropionate transaminase
VKTKSDRVLRLLGQYESPNVLWVDPAGGWPIVWERARGAEVWDAAGRKYLDLTAAFGVAAAGHANARVVAAGQKQMGRLLHAMGDVHPHAGKAELARALSGLTFERWSGGRTFGKTIFCNSGFEAVEAALKTALLATGKRDIIAFTGGYHGLGYGALNATHRAHFRGPFAAQLRQFGRFVPFPATAKDLAAVEKQIRRLLRTESIGAIVAEPIQARGGIHVPPRGFLRVLRQACDQSGALLILDEIYTGFGRTGRWFACEHEKTAPDLVCLGKALTGGFPLSACVGRNDVIDKAWPRSEGEAIHTSTFLGHPVGCAMALAQIGELQRRRLPERSAALGEWLAEELRGLKSGAVRGRGLMLGLELREPGRALRVVKDILQRGFILLPEGADASVISLTPPLTITRAQLQSTVRALRASLLAVA